MQSPLKSLSVAAIALTLTLLTIQGGSSQALAEGKSMWNPTGWFSGSQASQSDNSALEAKKRADMAQQQADAAQAEATKAIEAARKAREASEKARLEVEKAQLQIEQHTQKPTVQYSEETPMFTRSAEKQSKTRFSESAEETGFGKGKLWNPMSLFKGDSTADSAATKGSKEITRKPKLEAKSTTDSKSENWTMLGLLNKRQDKQTEAEALQKEAAGKAEAQRRLETPVRERPPEVAFSDGIPDYKTKAALIETEKGNIAIELFPDEAPKTVANFAKLVNDGFYNKYNMKFHRVIPGFVIQTGDPTGTGAGGSKGTVPLEAKNKLSHNVKGIVAMARGPAPDSASSQFYITLTPQTALDGKYAIFGKVISGLDVLDKIEKDDMLYGIRLVDMTSIKLDQPLEKKKLFSKMF